jgi:hypothetical protein
MEGGAVGHNFERDTPRDHLCHVWTLNRCFLISLTFPIDISYLIHSVGIKWNVGGCKLEKKLEAQH